MTTRKTVIFVLSMHRSGSSALTGCIQNYFGSDVVDLGKSQLMDIVDEAPKGYFENLKILIFNDSVMKHMNLMWYDIPPTTLSGKQNKIMMKFANKLQSIFQSEYTGNVIVIKDPRIIILWPLYQRVLHMLQYNCKIITTNRDTKEVCQSLIKRTPLLFSSYLHAEELCNVYKEKLENIINNLNKNIVYKTTFNDLVNTPQSVMNEINIFLVNEITLISIRNKEILDTFIEKKLKHFNCNDCNEN
jgi:hypothetical protein